MTYTNEVVGFDNHYGKREAKPATAVFCDKCAETAIPLHPEDTSTDNPYTKRLRHADTGFGWGPTGFFGTLECHSCGKAC